MANKKKEYYKPGLMTEGKRNFIQGLLQEYNIESTADNPGSAERPFRRDHQEK
jgi:hypothetical protein